MYIKIIGFISAILTTTAFLPQAIKTWKTRSTKDLSPFMFFLFFFGIIGWLFYGILLSDLPMILANSVTICLAGIIMYFIIKNNLVKQVNHVALYVEDIEKMKVFYQEIFHAKAGNLYTNHKNNFSSYFITFNSGPRIELMHVSDQSKQKGFDHISISVGSKSEVDKITQRLRDKGFEIKSEPRFTGDGYYESTFLDAEGNKIEITI